MYILSRVCAEFHDRKGNLIHRIGRADLLKFHEVPDTIREDLLFRMLVNDGSIELPPKSEAELKRIENDPTAGADAAGKKIKDTSDQTETKPETKPAKPAKAAKAETKTEDKAAEGKPAGEKPAEGQK